MRFKLDENADPRWRTPLEEAGKHLASLIMRGHVVDIIITFAKNNVSLAVKCREF
jgi:hypothetical protein